METFPKSSFFAEQRAPALPTPAEVRALNIASGNPRATSFNRPSTVMIQSLGLVIKYGADVTIVEAQTQMMLREQLRGQVTIPEVFGWVKDGRQLFIYMGLIEGETLQERWRDMNEDERLAVCKELRCLVKVWRALEQDGDECYIGNIGKRPLNDIFLTDHPELLGPFKGPHALQQFQEACGIEITSKSPIVFTHADLVPPNILLTKGENPKVAAIIDWGQSGWFPSYWEYCKARRVGLGRVYFTEASAEEWRMKYLPMIIDPVDEESHYHPWLWFALSKGI